MRFRAEAKVGLIVFLSLVALGGVYYFLGQRFFQTGFYSIYGVFDDVQRLSKRADVRMAGVRIGDVQSISLTSDKCAKVEFTISEKFKGAIPTDSSARITTGGLVGVGEYFVEIIPGSRQEGLKPGDYIRTVTLPNLEDVLSQVTDIIGGLQTTVKSANEILTNPEVREGMVDIVKNIEATTARSALLADDMRGLLADTGPRIEHLFKSVQSAADDFSATSSHLRYALESGGLQQVQAALASVQRAAYNIEVATEELKEFAQDKSFTDDIRQTISSARQAAEGAAEIVNRIEAYIPERNKKSSGKQEDRQSADSRKKLVGAGSQFDIYGLSDSGDARVDWNFTLARDNQFYRLGIFDLGEDSRLNLQKGKWLNDRSAVRYGLYGSRLGIGYDRLLDKDLALQLDLYRPNDPRLETKLRYDFSNNFGVWMGVEDLFGDGGPMFGFQYRNR